MRKPNRAHRIAIRRLTADALASVVGGRGKATIEPESLYSGGSGNDTILGGRGND